MRLRRNGALVAAACLLLVLGVTLGSQPLPSADTIAGDDWGNFRASREGDRAEPFFVAREGRSTEPRSPGAGEPALKKDSPPARSLELLASNLEKAQQRHSEEAIKEVARGVESYLAKASPETYAHTAFLSMRTSVAPVPVPGGGGLGAAGTSVRSFAATEATGPQPERVLADAAVVLTRGLEQDDRPELRQQCCAALARMGPVAVPALQETLKNARSPHHKQVAVQVLKQMGPGAQRAAPTLKWVADNGPMPVRGQAEQAFRFVYLSCGSAGINDVDHVLADRSRQHLNQYIQAVCRKHHVRFVAETVRSLPDETAKVVTAKLSPVAEGGTREQVIARWAEVRRRQVGAEDGVYFLICQDPPTVHVALGRDVKAKVPPRLTEQSLSALLRTHLQDKEKGLEKAVRLVEHELSRAR